MNRDSGMTLVPVVRHVDTDGRLVSWRRERPPRRPPSRFVALVRELRALAHAVRRAAQSLIFSALLLLAWLGAWELSIVSATWVSPAWWHR
jgi:hypothetical protein